MEFRQQKLLWPVEGSQEKTMFSTHSNAFDLLLKNIVQKIYS